MRARRLESASRRMYDRSRSSWPGQSGKGSAVPTSCMLQTCAPPFIEGEKSLLQCELSGRRDRTPCQESCLVQERRHHITSTRPRPVHLQPINPQYIVVSRPDIEQHRRVTSWRWGTMRGKSERSEAISERSSISEERDKRPTLAQAHLPGAHYNHRPNRISLSLSSERWMARDEPSTRSSKSKGSLPSSRPSCWGRQRRSTLRERTGERESVRRACLGGARARHERPQEYTLGALRSRRDLKAGDQDEPCTRHRERRS